MLPTFIIEGPDNSGKTTLAASLSKRLNMPVQHQTRPGSGKDFMLGFMAEQLSSHTIYDRSMAVSQFIYDKLLSRYQIIGATELDLFIDYTVFTIPTIICLPPPETVLNASAGREEMAGVSNKRSELYELYSNFAEAQISNTNVVVFDYTAQTIDDVVEWLHSRVVS